MRALLATINHDHPQRGMLDAFQKVFGPENVADCDYFHSGGESPDGMLIRMAREHEPDWIWLQVQDSNKITANAIRKIRAEMPHTIVTHWTGDLRPQISHYLSTICEATHATFCSSVGQIDMFKNVGAPFCQYVQIGLDWNEDVGAPERPPPFAVPDVVGYYGDAFPGTAQRVEAILALRRAGIGIGVVGQGWSAGGYNVLGHCHVKEQIHVWRAAKICLNVNHYNHVPLYYSDRQLIAMASGRPTVCHYVPMLEREFENWTHCVWYRKATELVEAVQALLRDPDMRARIGACGKNEVVRNHTWEARIRTLLPTIEELRG
jgi:hypothetical protein